MVKVKAGTMCLGKGLGKLVTAIPQDYYIGKYEVTQELWQAVMGENPSKNKGADLPVESVTWYDCQDFIKELNRLTGRCFRLPTTVEWVYAANGGNNGNGYKYSGSNKLSDVAWYDENSKDKTHPIGTKLPNELGIYDMSGNVWEWCQTRELGKSTKRNPIGEEFYKLCGGSWSDNAKYCRSVYADKKKPSFYSVYLGLRLVLSE